MLEESIPSDYFDNSLPSHFQCMICYDIPHPDSGFFESHCGNLICKRCTKDYLLTKRVECPHCRETADFQFIKDNKPIYRTIQNATIRCCYCKNVNIEFSEWKHHCLYECANRFERIYNFLEYPSEELQRLQIQPFTLELLSTIKKPIQIVSINGEYQSGKSTLLNYILAKIHFATGDGIQAKTKGAQLFIQNKENDSMVTLFLDTEGLGDKHSSFALHCLSFVISNHYLFRIRKNPSENEKRELQTILQLASLLQQNQQQKNVMTFVLVDTNTTNQVEKFKQVNKLLLDQLCSYAVIHVMATPMINFEETDLELFTLQLEKYKQKCEELMQIEITNFYESGLDLVELVHSLLEAVNQFKSLDQLSQFGYSAFQILIKDQAIKVYRKKLKELIEKTSDEANLMGLFTAFHEIASKEALLHFDSQSIQNQEEYAKQREDLKSILEDYKQDFANQFNNDTTQDYRSFLIGALTGTAVTALVGAGFGFSIVPSLLRFIRK